MSYNDDYLPLPFIGIEASTAKTKENGAVLIKFNEEISRWIPRSLIINSSFRSDKEIIMKRFFVKKKGLTDLIKPGYE